MRNAVFFGSVVAFALFSVRGMWLSAFPIAVVSVPVVVPLWLLTRKKHPSLGLMLSLATAATGMLLDAPGPIMLIAGGFGVAAWNVSLIGVYIDATTGAAVDKHCLGIRLMILLVTMIGTYAILLVARSLTVRIPFYIMTGIVVMTAFFFDRLRKIL